MLWGEGERTIAQVVANVSDKYWTSGSQQDRHQLRARVVGAKTRIENKNIKNSQDEKKTKGGEKKQEEEIKGVGRRKEEPEKR